MGVGQAGRGYSRRWEEGRRRRKEGEVRPTPSPSVLGGRPASQS